MIVFLNLKSFFSSNKILAAAFSVLMVVCLIGGLFGLNYVYCNVEFYNRYYSEQNTITVINKGKETLGPLETFLRSHEGRFSLIQGSFSDVIFDKESTFCVYIYACDDFKDSIYIERGRMFTNEEILSGAKKIILDARDVSFIGTSLRLQEEDFEVIGLGAENVIPFSALSDTAKIEKITFQTFDLPTGKERESLERDMREIFSGMTVEFPEKDTMSLLDFAPMLLPTAILVFLGFLNLGFLYIYFLKMRSRQYSVFRTLGASAFKIFLICLAEILLLFTAAFLLSLALYEIMMAAFFFAPSSILSIASSGLDIRNFLGPLRLLWVYLGLALLFVLCFLPSMIKSLKSDITDKGENFS